MKKVIGIYAGPYPYGGKWDEKSGINGTVGGSEVWVIEIAEAFQKKGYHVIVFGDPETYHFSFPRGVEYVPFKMLEFRTAYQHFDYFIINRKYANLIDNIECPKFYIMAHDCALLNVPPKTKLNLPLNYKIAYQSEFQKDMLKKVYQIPDDKFFYVRNGINQSHYLNDEKIEKKNKMVWSSQKTRGSKLIIEKILPLIRKEIPDFEIDVCGYLNNLSDDYFKAEGVNLIGRVSKEELAKRQRESKIWIYPNHGKFEDGRFNDETFCLTAVENGLSRNAIICADKGCFSTTLKGYKGFIGTELFDDKYILPEDKMDKFCDKITKQAIKILKDDKYRTKLADNAFDIVKKYTFEKAVEDWEREFNKGKACVVIPVYKTELSEFEEKSLQRCKEIFKNRDIYLVCGKSLDTKIYGFNENITVRFDDDFFKDINGYNRLCKSPLFYEEFENRGYKYMQIYQLDCWVFKDDLDDFVAMNYDYYGAPWAKRNPKTGEFGVVGNGGFSLRKLTAMIDICKKYGNEKDVPEDIYFSDKHGDEINVAPLSVCRKYSFECLPEYFFKENGYQMAMGCHQPFIYSADFYKGLML